jgi:transketolase
LTLIVDLNGLQGFGTTREVANTESLADKFRSFGFHVSEIDGHDVDAFDRTFGDEPNVNAPSVVVATTRKGNGVSFMEGRMEWHYLPLDEALYAQAVREIESADAAGKSAR